MAARAMTGACRPVAEKIARRPTRAANPNRNGVLARWERWGNSELMTERRSTGSPGLAENECGRRAASGPPAWARWAPHTPQ